jgi:hypothetical protein
MARPDEALSAIKTPWRVVFGEPKTAPPSGANWATERYYVAMHQHIATFAFANIAARRPVPEAA